MRAAGLLTILSMSVREKRWPTAQDARAAHSKNGERREAIDGPFWLSWLF